MTRRPYHTHHRRKLWILLALSLPCLWYGYQYFTFNPQKIIDNSELKDRNFNVKVEEITTPQSNIKAYFVEEKTNPIVSMSFVFKGCGYAYDPQGKSGLAEFSSAMFTEGAGDMDAASFKEHLENIAAEIGYSVDEDDFSGSFMSLKENLSQSVDMLRKTLYEPRLDEEDMHRTKRQTLQAIDHLQENPSNRLKEAFKHELYGNHPYARNALGIKKDVQSFNASDIRNFSTSCLTKDRLFVGIAGDLSSQEAVSLLDEVFADLPEKASTPDIKDVAADFSFRSIDIEDDTLPQILTMIAAPSVPRLHKDFYPLYIANYIIGGAGLNSRINEAAREKEGLTYGAYTSMSVADKLPHFSGGFSTTPQNFERMKEIFISEWKKMGEKGISAQELSSAKNYLQNSYNLRFADITTLSAMLAEIQKEDLGIDFLQKRNRYIGKVTLERVNSAAKEFFANDKIIMVNMGKIKSERNIKDDK
ncbi:MAG: insulinase family protein [Alphaproteobacteria bacterium]|nr:insulinase family protein [Alphaproteobacteria bacterium]